MKTISRVFARKLVQILPVVLPAAILLGFPTTSFAEDELDFSDTAWMIISTPWSCLWPFQDWLFSMAASSEAKMCCWFRCRVILLAWPNYHSVEFFGYSLSFDTTGMVGKTTNLNYFVGGMGKAFLRGIGRNHSFRKHNSRDSFYYVSTNLCHHYTTTNHRGLSEQVKCSAFGHWWSMLRSVT